MSACLHDLSLGQIERPEAHTRDDEEDEEGPDGPVARRGILGEEAVQEGIHVQHPI